MKRTLLHCIAEALRRAVAEADSAPAEREPVATDPAPPADRLDPEPLPPCQRRVKVSFDEVLTARGYAHPNMRSRLVPPSDVERARRAAKASMGWEGREVMWPD